MIWLSVNKCINFALDHITSIFFRYWSLSVFSFRIISEMFKIEFSGVIRSWDKALIITFCECFCNLINAFYKISVWSSKFINTHSSSPSWTFISFNLAISNMLNYDDIIDWLWLELKKSLCSYCTSSSLILK